jgi:hypothetical protein
MISALGKRVFLLHNVHEKGPLLFQTRWAMNYLAGPLTRTQIPALNRVTGAEATAATPSPAPSSRETPTQPRQAEKPVAAAAPVTTAAARPPASPAESTSATRPPVPGGISEYFLPANLSFTEAFKVAGQPLPQEAQSLGYLYRPVLLAQASVRYLNRKYELDYEQQLAAQVSAPDRRGLVRWEDFPASPLDPRSLEDQPAPGARFAALEAPLSDAKLLASMQKDFLDWAFRQARVSVRANARLGVYAGPQVSQADFRTQCAEAARKRRDEEIKEVEKSYQTKIDRLEARMETETRELRQDETEHSQRKWEEVGSGAETLLSLFGGRRRRLSTVLTKRRMTEQAKADVEESRDAIEDIKGQIAGLEQEKAQAIEAIHARWSELADDAAEISVTPLKKDVLVDLFGVAWFPYYRAQVNEAVIELPAFGEA